MEHKVLYIILGVITLILAGVYVWQSSVPVDRDHYLNVTVDKGKEVLIEYKNQITVTAE